MKLRVLSLKVTQETYVKKCLQSAQMDKAKPTTCPMQPGLRLTNDMSQNLSYAEEQLVLEYCYRAKLGSLIYILLTRADIYTAVSILSRFANHQSPQAVAAMQHLLAWLAGTTDHGLTFNKVDGHIELVGFVDSDFAGDYSSGIAGRSTSGFAFYLGWGSSAPISFKSKRQSTTATSTQHAEYIALFAAVKEAMFLRAVLQEIGIVLTATTIFEDNSSCIQLAHNPVHHERTKHYEVKLHYVREMVESGDIQVVKIHSSENIADLLTKPVTPQVLRSLVSGLLGQS